MGACACRLHGGTVRRRDQAAGVRGPVLRPEHASPNGRTRTAARTFGRGACYGAGKVHGPAAHAGGVAVRTRRLRELQLRHHGGPCVPLLRPVQGVWRHGLAVRLRHSQTQHPSQVSEHPRLARSRLGRPIPLPRADASSSVCGHSVLRGAGGGARFVNCKPHTHTRTCVDIIRRTNPLGVAKSCPASKPNSLAVLCYDKCPPVGNAACCTLPPHVQAQW